MELIAVASADRFGAGAVAYVVTVIVDGRSENVILGGAGLLCTTVVGNGVDGAVTVGDTAVTIVVACGGTIAGHNTCFRLLPPVSPGDFFMTCSTRSVDKGVVKTIHSRRNLFQ